MKRLTRRTCLAGLAASGLAHLSPASAAGYCSDGVDAAPAPATSPVPLGDMSDRVIWGVALESPALYDTALIHAVTGEKPKFLAIASGLKFGNLHPRSGPTPSEAWQDCDDIVALAARLRIPVRGDCLAWNDWVPSWLTDIVRDKPAGWQDAVGRIYDENFKSIFVHFAKLESALDFKLLRWCGLINEPFNPWVLNNGNPSWRKGAWLDAFGIETDGVPAYIRRAFALGERYASGSLSLFLNEANCDNDRFGPVVRPALLRLVDALKRSGTRIDAVGLECHLVPQWMKDPANPDWTPFVLFLRELQKRNVEIYITELDVNDCTLRDAAQRDVQVANYMHSLVEAALQVPAVTMLTNWDLSDKYSWLRSEAVYPTLSGWANCGSRPPCPRPALYDQSLRPKMAREALAAALRGKP